MKTNTSVKGGVAKTLAVTGFLGGVSLIALLSGLSGIYAKNPNVEAHETSFVAYDHGDYGAAVDIVTV